MYPSSTKILADILGFDLSAVCKQLDSVKKLRLAFTNGHQSHVDACKKPARVALIAN